MLALCNLDNGGDKLDEETGYAQQGGIEGVEKIDE
jgi:hypothetical protein